MPWWILGLSMVATTFSADTPNLVTHIVRTQGVAGNWIWWSFLITGMLTTFVYAKLWRRLGVSTDIEFYAVRYSGKSARLLRIFRALYLGLFFNIIVMASVTLAAVKISTVMFSVEPATVIIIAGFVTVIFSAAGGFIGVLITDLLLFFLAMAGSVLAAWYVLDHPMIGGLDALLNHVNVVNKTSFLPDLHDPDQYIPLLLVPLVVQWWSVWYPGSEPGGGGYVAQRLLAAKNEKHAVAASAFFQVCHYALRPWPWIIVALASLVIYPDIESLRQALPQVPEHLLQHDMAYSAMLMYLPSGVLGLVIASLAAAYISTISTSLNWGSSYVVNDFYRVINPDVSEKNSVLVGRIVTALLMLVAGTLALYLESALQAFRLLLSIGAGTGLLFLLRWFWQRINVWSEISAMAISFVVSMYFEFGPFEYLLAWQKMVLSVGVTTVGWISVTLLTPPVDIETLGKFNRLVNADEGKISQGIYATLWGTAAIYATLFCIGSVLYSNYITAFTLGLFALVFTWITRSRAA